MNNNKLAAKRGRPARLSRQKILEAALKLLEKSAAEVTVNGVARALNVGAMSLYTHIKNRDDLLLGVSELVLGQLELQLEADHWEDNVQQWVDQVRAHFNRYPQIVKLLGESDQLSIEWMRLESRLVSVLEDAGLREEDLVSTANLISQAVIFDCILGSVYARGRNNLQLPDLSVLPEEEQHGARLLYRHTPVEGHSLLDFVMQQLLQRDKLILQQ